MQRIVNDTERILNDIDRLDIDAEELELTRGVTRLSTAAEKIAHTGHPVRLATSGGTSMTRVSGVTAGAELGSVALAEHVTGEAWGNHCERTHR